MIDNKDRPSINVPLENIVEPTGTDVLSGRGVTTNRHPGNVSYRSLVALNKVCVYGNSMCMCLTVVK